MDKTDLNNVMVMMREFYSSEAVATNGSDEIFISDIENCINSNPYLEGYVFENNNEIQGYAMVAKSFSTEYGKSCMWIEDLFIKKEYRSLGLGSDFLKYIEEKYPDSIFRLEVEEENEKAVKVYKKSGFRFMPYMEMKKQLIQAYAIYENKKVNLGLGHI